MPQPQPASPRLPAPRAWRSVVLAWPGVLTLLSLLAVLLGQQPPLTDPGTRVTAGSVAPALPDLRPAPPPIPGPGLPAGPLPEPFRTPGRSIALDMTGRRWTAPPQSRSLALLGRRQTDGG